MISRICGIFLLLVCCNLLFCHSLVFADTVIQPDQENVIRSLVVPPPNWQTQHHKIDQINIHQSFLELVFKQGSTNYSITLNYENNHQNFPICKNIEASSPIKVCASNKSVLFEKYTMWLQQSNNAKKLEELWTLPQSSTKKTKTEFISRVKEALDKAHILSESKNIFTKRNNFYFQKIHYFLIIPIVLGFIFFVLSLQQINRQTRFCSNKFFLATLTITVLLYVVKWFTMPLENLILTDEWENLSVIREMFHTGVFMFREVDVESLPIEYKTLDYGPMFHIFSWFFTLTGQTVMKSAAIVNCIMTTALLPLFFILSRIIYPKHNKHFSLAMAFLFATLPTNITLSKTATTNPTLLFFLILLTIFVISAIKQKKLTYTNMLAICFASIFACHTRAEGLVIIGGTLAFYLLTQMWHIKSLMDKIKEIGQLKLLIFGVIFVFCTSPIFFYYQTVYWDYHKSLDINYFTQALIVFLNWAINIFSPISSPASIPLYLTIAVIVSVANFYKQGTINRNVAVFIAFVYCWLCLNYAFASFELFDATFYGKCYHLGPLYLILFILALNMYPTIQTYSNKTKYKILVLCLMLNLVGHLVQVYLNYHPNTKFTDGEILKSASNNLEENAVILSDTKYVNMIRFTANRSSSKIQNELIFKLKDQPIYYFDVEKSTDKSIDKFIKQHNITLENTKYERLYKVHLPSSNNSTVTTD